MAIRLQLKEQKDACGYLQSLSSFTATGWPARNRASPEAHDAPMELSDSPPVSPQEMAQRVHNGGAIKVTFRSSR